MTFLSGTPTRRMPIRLCILLTILGLFPAISSAQTFVGNHTLTTQAEVAAFTNGGTPYTRVEGDLTLAASGAITDLANLSSITTITGTLSITDWGADDTASAGNPLGAFTALTSVGNLLIGTGEATAVPGVQSLVNPSLETVSGNLHVQQAPNLATAAFPALTQTGGDLHLTNLPQLDYFSGTALATIGGQLRLNELDDLVNLDSLPAVASIGTNLIIRGNDNLTTLDGLSANVAGGAHFTLGELAVEFNQYLSTIESLSATVSDRLAIIYNNNLFDVSDGLELGEDMEAIEIYNNNSLEDISWILDGVNTVSVTNLTIRNNMSLRIWGTQALAATGSIEFANNNSAETLPNLEATTALTGTLTITNNAMLKATNGLRNLVSVGGGVTIRNNDGFTTSSAIVNSQPASALTGFNSLQRAAFLVFDGNDGMANLDDFSVLTVLDNALEITNNGALGDCCQLPCQVSVNGTAFDTYNDAVVVSNNSGACTDKTAIRSNCAGVGCAAVAPVTWTNFRAERQGSSSVRLDWRTASESQNAYFRVERSADGANFRPIGRVRGSGTSALARDYHFVDTDCPSGRIYYRLRQVDVDGTASFSEVRLVWMGTVQRSDLILYPNPVPAGGVVRGAFFGSGQAGPLTLEVFTTGGQRVLQLDLADGEAWELSTAALLPGIYSLRISDGSRVAVGRLAVR